jgi:amino acid adenylation domain-containing protein
MIIKKFLEQVERSSDNIALKAGTRSLTYADLDRLSNQWAYRIMGGENQLPVSDIDQRVSLLFEHGTDMILGLWGVLKAGKTYVPLDVTYPEGRLLYMVEHSETELILTDSKNRVLAEKLARQSKKQVRVMNIRDISEENTIPHINREVPGHKPAYILYTSGSTGKPKGVVQTHQNILHFVHHWARRFSLTGADRMSLLASFSHDGAVPDIFSALLTGAALFPYDVKKMIDVAELSAWLLEERITIWHSVPTLYRFFANQLTGEEVYPDLRLIILGGEEVREQDLILLKEHFPGSKFANIYGQTESTVNSIWLVSPDRVFHRFNNILIGDPIGDTEILLVDDKGEVVEDIGRGEIVVASDHLALGYWKDEENTRKVFTHDDAWGRLYWTGDLGKLSARGDIIYVGRKDNQVKIRGFRVELGEIESVLLRHEAVNEAVVTVKVSGMKENPGEAGSDTYLCAYVVPDERKSVTINRLRDYLSAELPDYMIPAFFAVLEKMPLLPNGKIDRGRLPKPGQDTPVNLEYEPPRNETERKLAVIWQQVLGVEKIGINYNFVELGGHSLLAISIISRIHKAFDVELELTDVLEHPSIKELARLILDSEKRLFSSIMPAEEREWYAAASEQLRLFILNEYAGIGTTYNIPGIVSIKGSLHRHRLEEVFQRLIKRHEALRTSFHLKNGEVIQRIHKDMVFKMEFVDVANSGGKDPELVEVDTIERIANGFIKPFNLGNAPLMRVRLVKPAQDSHLLLFDLHHIVSDGISSVILVREFREMYGGKELQPLRLQYKDYSEWQNHLLQKGMMKKQDEYWFNRFRSHIPVLELPLDYPRPPVQTFDGSILRFELAEHLREGIYQLMKETGTTLYMVLLAVYNILLHRYTQQEDIVIGSIIAGRNHADLEKVMGILVKTIPMRNFPAGNKTVEEFLAEVKENTSEAFKNQLYPILELMRKLELKTDRSRNPLFDVAFILQNNEMSLAENPLPDSSGLSLVPCKHENKNSKFDLTFEAYETPGTIRCCFQYCTGLFKRETIELMRDRILVLIAGIVRDRRQSIEELDFKTPLELELKENLMNVEFEF